MASAQANSIGIVEIVAALPSLTIAEVKEVVKAARISLTEHHEREARERMRDILPLCVATMQSIEPRLCGDLWAETKERIYVNARRAVIYYLFEDEKVPAPVIRKELGCTSSKVNADIEWAQTWLQMPMLYAAECSLYQMFRHTMKGLLTQR